jgi:hypothetical protein
MLRGIDADRRYERNHDAALPVSAARLLARIHAAGLVHGDAVLRNFLTSKGAMHAIDLPRWNRLTAPRAENDLAHLITSTNKRHPLPRGGEELLDAYAAASLALRDSGDSGDSDCAETLDEPWRDRVRRASQAFMTYLLERDATRDERHAKKRLRFLRAERGETPS